MKLGQKENPLKVVRNMSINSERNVSLLEPLMEKGDSESEED